MFVVGVMLEQGPVNLFLGEPSNSYYHFINYSFLDDNDNKNNNNEKDNDKNNNNNHSNNNNNNNSNNNNNNNRSYSNMEVFRFS